MNILLNALQSMDKPQKRIQVTTGLAQHDGRNWIRLVIADNGKGMKEEELQRVFDPFFTTKTQQDHSSGGTGLGLSISYTIINNHGGSIEATSQPGEGSSFTILLPVPAAP